MNNVISKRRFLFFLFLLTPSHICEFNPLALYRAFCDPALSDHIVNVSAALITFERIQHTSNEKYNIIVWNYVTCVWSYISMLSLNWDWRNWWFIKYRSIVNFLFDQSVSVIKIISFGINNFRGEWRIFWKKKQTEE